MSNVFLSSNSQLDIIEAAGKGYWEHSSTPKQVNVGDKVIIVPNAKEKKVFGANALALVATLSGPIGDIETNDWASNKEGSKQVWVAQLPLTDMVVVKFSDIAALAPTMPTSGIRYVA